MMKQEPEQFEPNQQTVYQAPQTLIPNVLAQLGLEGKRKNVDHSLASLTKSLQAENWQTRLVALEALHQQSGAVPIEPLLLALHDADASVRAMAVRLLGQRDDSVAIAGLEEALHDSDWHVRETAVFTLGQHISPPVDLLMLAQNDEDSAVRKAAAGMLQDMQTESYTVRSLSHDEVLQTQSTTHFSKAYDYTNNLLRHIQGLEDRIVPRQHSQANKNSTTLEEGDGKGKQRPVLRVLEVFVAAIIVLGLVGSWFTLTHSVLTSTQGHANTTLVNKGTRLYHQDEMTPAVYWTSNSQYVYINDKQNTVLHFINIATKHVTTIANPDMVAQTTGKLATLTPDSLSVCTVDNTGSALHIRVQSVLTNKILFDASYPKIANTRTGIISQWSNDGTRIALGSDNGIITIANVKTVQPLVVLKGVHTPAKTLEWSQDDRQLLTTNPDGVMQAWNTNTGQRLFVVTVRSDTVSPYQQAFSPDGKRIAIVPNTQSIQILDATTGKIVFTYHDVTSPQSAYYRWIDSTHIISHNDIGASNMQHMQVWDVVTGHVTLDIPPPVSAGAYSTYANSKYVVVPAPNAPAFQVWDAITGRKVATHNTSSIYLSFGSSTNEKYFITTAGGSDNKIDMWSATTGKTVATYSGSDNSVVSAQWSPDGKYLLSLSTNGRMNPVGATLDLWQAPS